MASVPQVPTVAVARRVVSIDALRGFDMFWIIGGDALAIALLDQVPGRTATRLQEQFTHVDWEGFRFYDLIFPLFLFMVGCALPYSLAKYRDRPRQVYWRIARRTLLLIALGLVFNGALDFQWAELRYVGVLQRIGICYGIAALLVVHVPPRRLWMLVPAILLSYWALLAWVAPPGGVAGDLSKAGNLAAWLDRALLPGRILPEYYGDGDNEGILSTLPAIATTLLGALAGVWLRSAHKEWRKVAGLFGAGLMCLLLGHFWSAWFPIIKNLWTSSFVLVAGGWSLLLLGLFYAVIDVLGWRRGSWFWVVIGMNAITIYMAQELIDFEHTARLLFSGVARLSGSYGDVVLLIGILALEWLLLWLLYRQRIFLRV